MRQKAYKNECTVNFHKNGTQSKIVLNETLFEKSLRKKFHYYIFIYLIWNFVAIKI